MSTLVKAANRPGLAKRHAPAPAATATATAASSTGRRGAIAPTVVRTSIALILLWAGLSKISDPFGFFTSLLAYQLPLPGIVLKLAAVSLPWLELLCALMLVTNFHRPLAIRVCCALFGIFLLMTAQAAVRGLSISCGCFNLALLGIAEGSPIARFVESVGFAVFRNLILLAGLIYLLRASPSPATPPSRSGRTP